MGAELTPSPMLFSARRFASGGLNLWVNWHAALRWRRTAVGSTARRRRVCRRHGCRVWTTWVRRRGVCRTWVWRGAAGSV